MLVELRALLDAVAAGRSVVFTELVETRGSTPQKPGAMMLVFPDGRQVGTLGGGCVEAEVKRRALRSVRTAGAELLTFRLDSDYGWDDGLICGGRMRMLVDALPAGTDASYYQSLWRALAAGRGATEAVVIEPQHGAPGIEGARWLFDADGRLIAVRDADPLAAEDIARSLRPLEDRPRPYAQGGVAFVPHFPRARLLIVGAGHVGQRVADLAGDLDFDVWVLDDRGEYCNRERFPKAQCLIVGPMDAALRRLRGETCEEPVRVEWHTPLDEREVGEQQRGKAAGAAGPPEHDRSHVFPRIDHHTYCLIVTRGHHHDEEALYYLAESEARYVGLIGSRRKIKLIFGDLLREGIAPEALRRVHAPLGIDIGSQTVPEIAVSICAELVAHRNLGSVPPGYRRPSLMDELEANDRRNADAAVSCQSETSPVTSAGTAGGGAKGGDRDAPMERSDS
ncbi:MAG: XdhC/CoxI family protein [Planctomycetota bacterium]|nr:MAG: XdhC/CoxI family protein [Planctomycetota bacterium]